jgi:hypothetical protein
LVILKFSIKAKRSFTYLSSLLGDRGAARFSTLAGRKTITIAPNMLEAVSKVISQCPPTVFCGRVEMEEKGKSMKNR